VKAILLNALRRFWLRLLLLMLGVCVLLLVSALLFWHSFQTWLDSSLPLSEQGYSYELKPGQTLGHLAYTMAKDGQLTHPRWLRLYARFLSGHKFHAGEYHFEPGTTPRQLMEKLVKGDVILYQVTILEGWTFAQALVALAQEDALDHQLRGLSATDIKQKLKFTENEQLEGWFFPDTYNFGRYTSDIEVLQRAHEKMRSFLTREWEERAENLPFANAYEALILASIVERETGAHSERDQIAGVFVRRLQRGMRLQTDPTVIYGMGDSFKGNITRKDLSAVNPYNTYQIDGLPPTPISLPSAASIHAVMHPAPGDALFFVAKGDGTTEFSATLDQHNAAVRRFQLKRRSDYRSTPKVQRKAPVESAPKAQPAAASQASSKSP